MWSSDSTVPVYLERWAEREWTGHSLYGRSGRTEQEDFLKKKKTLGALWGILLQQQLQPPLHRDTHLALPQGCGGYQAQILSIGVSAHLRPQAPNREHVILTWMRPQTLTRESATQRDMRPKAPGREPIKEGPTCAHP